MFVLHAAPVFCMSWWRHQMETFSALLAICAGNSLVPVNFTHKIQWRGAVILSLICVGINGWVNNREAVDLRRYHAHYDVIVVDWYQWLTVVNLSWNQTRFSYSQAYLHNWRADVSLQDTLAVLVIDISCGVTQWLVRLTTDIKTISTDKGILASPMKSVMY